jgi:hypothetical protein
MEDVVSQPDVAGEEEIADEEDLPSFEEIAAEVDVVTEEPKKSADDGCTASPVGTSAAGWLLLALLLGLVAARRYSPDSRP